MRLSRVLLEFLKLILCSLPVHLLPSECSFGCQKIRGKNLRHLAQKLPSSAPPYKEILGLSSSNSTIRTLQKCKYVEGVQKADTVIYFVICLYGYQSMIFIYFYFSVVNCMLYVIFLYYPFQDSVLMQFCANKLDKKDFFGKSDPFLVFHRSNEDGRQMPVKYFCC